MQTEPTDSERCRNIGASQKIADFTEREDGGKEEWKEQMKNKWEQEWHRKNHGWTPPGSVGGPGAPGQNPGGPNNFTTAKPPADQPIPEPAGPTTQPDPNQNANNQQSKSGGAYSNGSGYSSEDYIDTTSIFGGVHKKVVSKNFRGGDVVTFLGGSEIDLSQAEIIGTARLDVTQVMGGTKIIVPAHWEVRSEVTALFAGFEDKRQQPAMINPEKVLIIDGTSIFGGIELKNY